MGKVTFEFDENEDRYDINVIVNRHKLMCALDKLVNYKRDIYKGYVTDAVIATGEKILGKLTDKISEEYKDMPKRVLIEENSILNELDDILSPVKDLLDC